MAWVDGEKVRKHSRAAERDGMATRVRVWRTSFVWRSSNNEVGISDDDDDDDDDDEYNENDDDDNVGFENEVVGMK